MAATSSSLAPESSGPPLPLGFKTIEEIQNLPNDKIRAGELVSVIGFVKDYQPPVSTRGTDWKCTLEIKDPSIQYSSHGLKIIIFSAHDKMPKIHGVGDVLLIRKIKVQMYSGTISLLKNQATEFYVLPATKIPRGPAEVPNAPWQSFPALVGKPTRAETTYVAVTATGIGEMSLPSNEEFQQKAAEAVNVKDKFSLLKDVKPEGFYTILGEVIRVFDGSAGRVTVYLSDFTANSFFYEYTWKEADDQPGYRERDEYGNNKSKSKAGKDWPGPFGKMTIQLTLYDAHAEFVRESVKVGQWVILRNVQMKFGKMGGCLEGFLRGDTRQFESAVRVEVMERKEEKDQNDTRWTEAVRRKYECEKKFKKQRQAFLDEAAGLGEKRKRDDEPTKSNAKRRRKEKLAAAARKAAAADAKIIEKLDLNENIRCSYPDMPTMSIPSILKPQRYLIDKQNDQEIDLPFVVAKYKANVRVVGYYPPKLQDFTVSRRVSEYDMLSDYSGGEDTDPEEFKRSWANGKGAPKKVWEWRFALEVEDAGKKTSKERMWLIVDNASAQCLLDMDAVNLRSKDGREILQQLKEKLCILWGDLEEQKSALEPPDSNPEPKSSFTSSINIDMPSSLPNLKAGAQPNVDSDDENDCAVKKEPARDSRAAPLETKDPNVGLSVNGRSAKTPNLESKDLVIHNKAFTCCIKQYGVKVKEEDASKATAGDGKRWERKFGLFGVIIS